MSATWRNASLPAPAWRESTRRVLRTSAEICGILQGLPSSARAEFAEYVGTLRAIAWSRPRWCC